MDRWEIVARKGFSPTFVLACGLVGSTTFVVAYSVVNTGRFSLRDDVPAVVGQFSCVAAYLIGLLSCWNAAAIYPKNSPIRWGWFALSANCLLSLFRHAILNPLLEPWFGSTDRVYLFSQVLQLPALVCVLSGILGICWGVYRLGLGFHLRWLESVGVVSASAIVAWACRNHLSHAQSGNTAAMILQTISFGLLLSIGGVGLLLHSLAMQMQGGHLAVVLRCVSGYGLTRSLLTLEQVDRKNYLFIWWLLFYTVPWIFTFGASYFCWLAETVRRSIRSQPFSDWDVSSWAR